MANSNFSKRLQAVLYEGSPKQKALLVCKEYLEPTYNSNLGEKPALTSTEVRLIKDSLKTEKEKKEYLKYLNCGYVFLDITTLFGVAVAEYTSEARLLVKYLNIWEIYEQESDFVNSLYLSVKEAGSKKAEEAFCNVIKNGIDLHRYGGFQKGEDGFFFIDYTILKRELKEAQRRLIKAFSSFKALIVAIEDFAQENSCKAFIPRDMQLCIDEAKKDYELFEMSSRYSCRELRLRKEKGERITPYDEERALYPEYKDIEPAPDYIKIFQTRLNEVLNKGR